MVVAVDGILASASLLLSVVYAAASVVFVVVGLLIVERRPGNVVGAIVLGFGMLFALYLPADAYIRYAADAPGAAFAALYIGVLDLPAWMLIALVVLLFPDGRAPSPAWRRLMPFELAVVAVGVVGAGFNPGPFMNTPAFDNPIGIAGFPGAVLLEAAYVGMLVAVVLSAVSLVGRWRRGNAVERAQLKWVAAGSATFAATAVLTVTAYGLQGGINPVLGVVSSFGIALFPITIGIAVLRYRLYEIDRIVSRGLSYALLTGSLAAIFAGLVIALQAALADVTQGQTLAVAGSTLVAFALFAPLRRRIQHVMDGRFNRTRYDAERIAAAFADHLRDEVEPGMVTVHLDETVRTAVAPSATAVWLRSRNDLRTKEA
jgi:hypothetical protein